MERNGTITCTERGRSSLTPLVILLCIGIPHFALGATMLAFHDVDTTLLICGGVFTLSGSILLLVSLFLFLKWLNRKVVADERGLTYTDRFGRAVFAPWDQVSVTDQAQDRPNMELHLAGRDVSFSQGCKGYDDLRAELRDRGLLLDKAGRHKPLATQDEVIEVRRLV